jgi:hypothetical protein
LRPPAEAPMPTISNGCARSGPGDAAATVGSAGGCVRALRNIVPAGRRRGDLSPTAVIPVRKIDQQCTCRTILASPFDDAARPDHLNQCCSSRSCGRAGGWRKRRGPLSKQIGFGRSVRKLAQALRCGARQIVRDGPESHDLRLISLPDIIIRNLSQIVRECKQSAQLAADAVVSRSGLNSNWHASMEIRIIRCI